jgi:rRNA-processing protein FCF1
MKVVMDADCLIKLAKSGAKEAIVSAMEVHIPTLVKKEVVDEAAERGYQDGIIIEKNIDRKVLHVVSHGKRKSHVVSAAKGESDVLTLYETGEYDAVASDDRKFLKRLEAAHIPFVTPAACLVYLSTSSRIGAAKVRELLESLKPFISLEEYTVARLYLEGKT